MNVVACSVQWGSCITPSCPGERGPASFVTSFSVASAATEIVSLLIHFQKFESQRLQISLTHYVTSLHVLKYVHIIFPGLFPLISCFMKVKIDPSRKVSNIKPAFISLHELQYITSVFRVHFVYPLLSTQCRSTQGVLVTIIIMYSKQHAVLLKH